MSGNIIDVTVQYKGDDAPKKDRAALKGFLTQAFMSVAPILGQYRAAVDLNTLSVLGQTIEAKIDEKDFDALARKLEPEKMELRRLKLEQVVP